jgi:cytochrome b6-f complex iron-sulfur subunit
MRNARRFVADLIGRRRPRSFPAGPEDAAEIRAAIMLRAAAPGADEPSEEFIERLHGKLESTLSTSDPPRPSRRRIIVQTTTIAAASAAIGAVAGSSLRGEPDSPIADTLTPTTGTWQPIAASTDLPDGAIQAFDLGSIVGFVQRRGGELRAVSGICTHLGCKLGLDAPHRRLTCPCHRTNFTPDGAVLDHQLPVSPPPLPHIPVREENGTIQILAPAEPA